MDVIDNMSQGNRRDLMSEVRPLWNRLLLDAKNKKRSKDTINNEIKKAVDETI